MSTRLVLVFDPKAAGLGTPHHQNAHVERGLRRGHPVGRICEDIRGELDLLSLEQDHELPPELRRPQDAHDFQAISEIGPQYVDGDLFCLGPFDQPVCRAVVSEPEGTCGLYNAHPTVDDTASCLASPPRPPNPITDVHASMPPVPAARARPLDQGAKRIAPASERSYPPSSCARCCIDGDRRNFTSACSGSRK